MIAAILKENIQGETRVAATPKTVKELIDNSYEILTTPSNLSEVIEALNSKGIEMLNAESTMRAEILVKLDQDALEKVLKIMNFLDDLDDVQEVHTNAEFPDDFNKEE